MQDKNHTHCNHEHEVTNEKLRYGSRLEDGVAHTRDHELWSRRDFLTHTGLGLAGASMMLHGTSVTAFGHAPLLNAISQNANNRILVLLQLNGGNDSLNMVVPFQNDVYHRVRPNIRIPEANVIKLANDHGLHPAMQSLGTVWNDGNLATVVNTGYNRSTRSHFAGTVNWATGSGQIIGGGDANFNSGIWGRYAHNLLQESNGILNYPAALNLGGPVSLFASPVGNLGVSLGDASFIEEVARRGLYDAEDQRLDSYEYGVPVKYVRSVANSALSFVTSIQDAANNGTNLTFGYEGGLGDDLASIARLIRGGLGTQIFSVSIGGFDTHSNQGSNEGRHADRLRQIANSVSAFLDDLSQDGLDERVMVMTFSEFGRTLGENGSQGTDHGAGGALMLFGKGVKQGVLGEQSDLVSQLYGGDPEPTTDFRSVSASILQDWFGLPGDQVDDLMGASFPRMDLVEEKIQVSNEAFGVPDSFELKQNYPNPFNPSTTISYSLSNPGVVSLNVYDLNGRLIQTLVDGHQAAGPHAVTFEARNLPSGTYVYKLSTAKGTETRKMILVK